MNSEKPNNSINGITPTHTPSYTAPEAEVIEIVVERGFWGSNDYPNT